MLDYTGVKCPVCGVPFQADDDIVVCPECGAPYHRECYQKEGRCIFEDLHSQGKEWQPPEPPRAPDPAAEIKDRECPVCGTLNGHSALFCSRCGASLLGEPQKYNNPSPSGGQAQGNQAPPYQPYQPYGGQPRNVYGSPVPPFSFDPMGGVSPAEPLDDGVTFGDASKLVKQNTNYYMPVFRYIKQTGRNKFNFSAFLFSGAWMLYRKQYKAGAVVTALMFLLQIAYQCAYWLVCIPAFTSLAAQAGVDLMESADLSSEQLIAISALAAQDLSSYLKILLPFAFLLGMLVVMIVTGIRGNKMYLRHCTATVRTAKAQSGPENSPDMLMDGRGGVNPMVCLCVFLCWSILSTFLPMLLII